MSYDIYEILIRGYGNKYLGASMQMIEGGERKFISDAQWPSVCKSINQAALARVDELTAELAVANANAAAVLTELEAYKARGLQAAKTVASIVDNPALAPEQKAAAIKSVTQDIQANERESKRLAALAKLAEAQAEADKFK